MPYKNKEDRNANQRKRWAAGLRHPKFQSSEYKIWQMMKDRCNNPNAKQYQDYGGRGIVVCDRWKDSFDAFMEDMESRPKDYTIERLDNDGHYEPSNCVWATRTEQRRNTRQNVHIEIDGVTRLQKDWCDLIGIPESTVTCRVKKQGLSPADAITNDQRYSQWKVKAA